MNKASYLCDSCGTTHFSITSFEPAKRYACTNSNCEGWMQLVGPRQATVWENIKHIIGEWWWGHGRLWHVIVFGCISISLIIWVLS